LSKDLVIGQASLSWMEEMLAARAAALGLSDALHELFMGSDDETVLCSLNAASFVLFLDHVSTLDGHADSQIAFEAFRQGDSKFRNMPWWDDSIWLPFEFTDVGTIEGDFPTFVGCCPALLRELEAIKSLSQLGLGNKPSGYDEMREDISAFYRSAHTPLDEADTIRWIWRALYDGAEIAMTSKSILWAGP
jgi:hypothetical protein